MGREGHTREERTAESGGRREKRHLRHDRMEGEERRDTSGMIAIQMPFVPPDGKDKKDGV